MRASEGGRRGSREGLWGPCPRQWGRQRPKVSGPACWRAGPQEAGLAGVWRGEREGVGTDGASKWLSVTQEDFEQRRADHRHVTSAVVLGFAFGRVLCLVYSWWPPF